MFSKRIHVQQEKCSEFVSVLRKKEDCKRGKFKWIGVDPVPEENFDLRGTELSPRRKRTSLSFFFSFFQVF